MKFRGYMTAVLLCLVILPAGSRAAEEKPMPRHHLMTAADLLKQKGLTPLQSACAVGGASSGLITAEDLLRRKGLTDALNPGTRKKNGAEEDIWGLEQDFGC